ncbi:hypothetical protein [Bradyrhizobium genosp. SA-3]|nr:hypothetical protein [Bradyrhizobium genosp. SA-3]
MDVVVAALTVSFKTSVVSGATTKDACNRVMRESLHRFVMKTLK